MNDLGWTLAWLTIQVGTLLVPSLGLQTLASRRGPDSGSWVATWSLGLVVALGIAAILPGIGSVAGPTRSMISTTPSVPASPESPVGMVARSGPGASPRAAEVARPLPGWRALWDRLGHRALGSSRVHPWGRSFAFLVLCGMGVGLIRLILGLWAVSLSRRCGKTLDDGPMFELVEELRGAMRCRRVVEIREIPDLATPATAGWRRPMLLLPSNWQSWDETEQRAVVAHELAHVVRGDFAAGLLARVAVVLNYHNPLVRSMAGRLYLEQELAADALGARFAGGPAAYLVALSGLALKQDAWSPRWPARAFLPARGTLIRRIAMLRNEARGNGQALIWSRPKQLLTLCSLLALTAALATWRAPARGEDDAPSTGPSDSKAEPFHIRAFLPSLEPVFVPESMAGIVAFRPAAAFRQTGLNRLSAQIYRFLAEDLEMIAKTLQVDPSQPGMLKFGFEEVESVIFGFNVGQPRSAPIDPKRSNRKLHSLEIRALTVRMVAPFDWLAFFRQWKVGVEEVREGGHVYHKLTFPDIAEIDFPLFVYLPDDRTIVADEQKWIGELVRRKAHSAPGWVQGADWRRVSRGLVGVAVNNQGDAFTKQYDLGRPDDAVVMQCFQGVDRWMLGMAYADEAILHAEATTRDSQSAEAVTRTIGGLVKLGQAAIESATSAQQKNSANSMLAKQFLANLIVASKGQSVAVSDEGFGTLADISKLIEVSEAPKANPVKSSPKAEARIEKR